MSPPPTANSSESTGPTSEHHFGDEASSSQSNPEALQTTSRLMAFSHTTPAVSQIANSGPTGANDSALPTLTHADMTSEPVSSYGMQRMSDSTNAGSQQSLDDIDSSSRFPEVRLARSDLRPEITNPRDTSASVNDDISLDEFGNMFMFGVQLAFLLIAQEERDIAFVRRTALRPLPEGQEWVPRSTSLSPIVLRHVNQPHVNFSSSSGSPNVHAGRSHVVPQGNSNFPSRGPRPPSVINSVTGPPVYDFATQIRASRPPSPRSFPSARAPMPQPVEADDEDVETDHDLPPTESFREQHTDSSSLIQNALEENRMLLEETRINGETSAQWRIRPSAIAPYNDSNDSDSDVPPPLVPLRGIPPVSLNSQAGDIAQASTHSPLVGSEDDGDSSLPPLEAVPTRTSRSASSMNLGNSATQFESSTPLRQVDPHGGISASRTQRGEGMPGSVSQSANSDPFRNSRSTGRPSLAERLAPRNAIPGFENLGAGMQNSLEMMASALLSVFGPESAEDMIFGDDDHEEDSSDEDVALPPLESLISQPRPGTTRERRRPLSGSSSDSDDHVPALEFIRPPHRENRELLFSSNETDSDNDSPPPLEPMNPQRNNHNQTSANSFVPFIPDQEELEIEDDDNDDEWTDEDDYFEVGHHSHGHDHHHFTHHNHHHHHHHHPSHLHPHDHLPNGNENQNPGPLFPFPFFFSSRDGNGGPPLPQPFEVSIDEFGHTFVSFNPLEILNVEMAMSMERPPDPARARELITGLPTVTTPLLKRLVALEKAGEAVAGEACDGTSDGGCSICLDPFIDGDTQVRSCTVLSLPCNHAFHRKCLQPWFERRTTCPNCRFDIDPNSLTLRLHNDAARNSRRSRWALPSAPHRQTLTEWIEERERGRGRHASQLSIDDLD